MASTEKLVVPVTKPAPSPMRILVVRPSSLGDIVHTFPIINDLRTRIPGAVIDWVAEEPFVPLLTLHEGIRRVIPIALRRWRQQLINPSTWRQFREFLRALRAERYHAILDLQEQVKGALISSLAHGPAYGPDWKSVREPIVTLVHARSFPIDPEQHLIDRCRQLAAQAMGYSLEAMPLRFGLRSRLIGARPQQPYLVFLHATSRDDKLWPEERWRELIAHFTRAGFAVLLPWGNSRERERSHRLAKDISKAQVPDAYGLPELASLLSGAELVCGVDTGIVHLSAALGTATISLFVATDPALAGVARTGGRTRDLGGVGLAPSVERVLTAAAELMRAAPAC